MQMNPEKVLDFFRLPKYNTICRSGTLCPVDDAELCKGSTNDSDSFSLGSNPSSAARPAAMVKRLRRRPLTAKTGVRVPVAVLRKVAEAAFFFLFSVQCH